MPEKEPDRSEEKLLNVKRSKVNIKGIKDNKPGAMAKEEAKHAKLVEATDIARDLGNPRLVNTILLGVMSQSIDLAEEKWLEVIERMAPKGTGELNIKAFLAGRST